MRRRERKRKRREGGTYLERYSRIPDTTARLYGVCWYCCISRMTTDNCILFTKLIIPSPQSLAASTQEEREEKRTKEKKREQKRTKENNRLIPPTRRVGMGAYLR